MATAGRGVPDFLQVTNTTFAEGDIKSNHSPPYELLIRCMLVISVLGFVAFVITRFFIETSSVSYY